MYKFRKSAFAPKKFHLLFFALLFLSFHVQAQYNIVTPSNFETPKYSLLTTVTALNTAVFANAAGTVHGVIYDDGSGGLLKFRIDDNAATSLIWAINGVGVGYNYSNPDMVLGGDGTHNYVGIVYTAESGGNKNVYLEVWTLTNVGLPVPPYMGISVCSAGYVQLTTSNNADNAHIDLVHIPSGGRDMADDFVISWKDVACAISATYGVRSCAGSLATEAGSCFFTPLKYYASTPNTGCINTGADADYVDVTGYRSLLSPRNARYAYVDPTTGELFTNTWDFTVGTGTLGTETSVDNPGAGIISNPRIDAYDQPVIGTVPSYEIVYNYYNGSGNNTQDVKHVSDINTTGEIATSYYNSGTSTSNTDNFSPVVTCGPTNGLFSLAYANPDPSVDAVYVQNIAWTTSNLTVDGSGNVYYYQANKNSGINAPVAISNDWVQPCGPCTFAPDEIYTCWFNATNGNIECKSTNANPPAFKPTGVVKVKTVAGAGSILTYPNPATDELFINTGEKTGDKYSIADINGHTVVNGMLDHSTISNIKVSGLPAGIYILTVSNTDKSTDILKFEKK